MIELTLVQGKGFVFLPSHARVLREEYRIVGSLIGSLPAHPHQNIHLGLPLHLSVEEVTLLLEKGIAKFKYKNNYPGHCSESELAMYEDFVSQSFTEQIDASKRARLDEIDAMADIIVEGKFKTLARSKKKKKKKSEEASEIECDVAVTVDPQKRLEILDDVRRRIQPLSPQAMFVQTHDVNPFVVVDDATAAKPCECDEGTPRRTENPQPSPRPPRFEPVVWSHPSTAKEKLKYETFKHFWEEGYYVSNGAKFGGDFLVYPGDPSRFHSFFVVQCFDTIDGGPISPQNLVTLARLGTSVKKTLVLCSFDDDGRLTLTSLEWSHWN